MVNFSSTDPPPYYTVQHGGGGRSVAVASLLPLARIINIMIRKALVQRLLHSTTTTSVLPHQARCLSSSSDSTLTSWERSAKLVKNTDKTNQYLEHIRQEHDPALHIKTLEDELRATMGKALGKQGNKVLRHLAAMKQQVRKYEALLEDNASLEDIRECVQIHNQLRKDAQHARWELMVQRQAVGMLVDNQKFVNKMYPIGNALPLPEEDGTMTQEKEVREIDSNDEHFGNQLDWWQRVGRWR